MTAPGAVNLRALRASFLLNGQDFRNRSSRLPSLRNQLQAFSTSGSVLQYKNRLRFSRIKKSRSETFIDYSLAAKMKNATQNKSFMLLCMAVILNILIMIDLLDNSLSEKSKRVVSAELGYFTHFSAFVKSILTIFFCMSYLTVNNIKCVFYKFFTDMPSSIPDSLENVICLFFT